jgi:outer membrane lipoprotein-sorting protein
MLKIFGLVAVMTMSAVSVGAQTVDEIIAHYIKAVGGMDKIESIRTLRRTGKWFGGGGFEAVIVQENKRDSSVREEFSLQGMTAINAYDGRTGWKIEPWNGKKDPEALGEEEMKSVVEDADFDGPLIDYKRKGNKVEFIGIDKFEGTDTYKLRVTKSNGDVYVIYLDTDFYMPIRVDTKRIVRGEEREYETALADYKLVNGWYLPYSVETNPKGRSDKTKVVFDKIEANVQIDDQRFAMPKAATPSDTKP